MTHEEKIEAIKKILPDKTSTINQDISYVNLVNYIKTIVYGKK